MLPYKMKICQQELNDDCGSLNAISESIFCDCVQSCEGESCSAFNALFDPDQGGGNNCPGGSPGNPVTENCCCEFEADACEADGFGDRRF